MMLRRWLATTVAGTPAAFAVEARTGQGLCIVPDDRPDLRSRG